MIALRRLAYIAWRNVFRNKRRGLLTLAVLVIGSTGLILIGGFFDNILLGLRDQLIHSQAGHLQVTARDFFHKGVTDPLEYLLNDVSQLQEEIESLPHVLYTVPRLQVSGMASSDNASVAALVLGTDAERESKMGSYRNDNSKISAVQIVEGRDLRADDPYGAVLGKGLLSALGLKIGDAVTVLSMRKGGALDSAQYIVRGSFVTVMKEIDDRVIRVNLETAQKLAGVPGHAHSLLLVLDQTDNTPVAWAALADLIRRRGWDVEWRAWHELMPFYSQSRAMLKKIERTIQVIVCIVFFFSIANTVNMSLLERIREFGTMMAIGNPRAAIFLAIVLEVLFLGLMGGTAGLLIGGAAAKLVSVLGIEMPPPPQGSNPYFAMITLSPALLIRIFLIAVGATVLSGLVPAYRAVHFRIVRALGYV